MDPAYMRYYLSTYNLSNSIAVACFFDVVPTPEQVDRFLRANVHFHLPEQWFYTGEVEVLRQHYWPRLTPALPQEISADLQQRTGNSDEGKGDAP